MKWFKKKNIKTYVDIEEITINTSKKSQKIYSVVFTECFDAVLMGITFSKKEIKTTIPFYFKSLEIAKDFAQLNPTYAANKIGNYNYYDRGVEYHTYQLFAKEKICYIKWTNESIVIEDAHNVSFYPTENYPIVDSFVTRIRLIDWMRTHGLNDVIFYNETEKLSDCLNLNLQGNKKWHFELVESND